MKEKAFKNFIREMKHVSKTFDATHALKDVSFSVERGSIHALIGENGAGKSTLMNILGGVVKADSGKILIDGNEVQISCPSDAKTQGIAFIHQELNVINDLSVYENMFLGSEIIKKSGLIDIHAMCEKCKQVLGKLEIELDPRTLVSELNASYKQIIEISKAILLDAKVIIMDEPTTSLTNIEIENVFSIMRALRNRGVSIVFISHKLKEVISVCDQYTVLRDGAVVVEGDINRDAVCEVDLARHMVGKDIKYEHECKLRDCGSIILEVSNYSLNPYFNDISFSVSKGEIVGFTGLLGDGRSDLFQALFGIRKGAKGIVIKKGQKITILSPEHALVEGIGYVPRNRKENGIIKDLSILENMTIVNLGKFLRRGFIDKRSEIACCKKYTESLKIKINSPENLITSLSGGNQQKVVLAKWLESNPDLLILDNPTQGVDVGAKNEIYTTITELADNGMSIALLSSEPQEVLRVCDRIYVMFHGRIAGELQRQYASEEKIMILSTGGSLN